MAAEPELRTLEERLVGGEDLGLARREEELVAELVRPRLLLRLLLRALRELRRGAAGQQEGGVGPGQGSKSAGFLD